MSCPGATVKGYPPTFTAYSTQTATITFSLDNQVQLTTSGVSATYTPNPDVTVGEHYVSVTVSNANGSSYKSCIWKVEEPLYVVFTNPEASGVLDLAGSIRSFTAVANRPATIEFCIDRITAGSITQNTLVATLSDIPIGNGHIIEVIASASNDIAMDSCLWGLLVPVPPCIPAELLDSDECRAGTVLDGDEGIYAHISVELHGNSEIRYIKYNYIISCKARCMGHYNFLRAKAKITISWPIIGEENVNNSLEIPLSYKNEFLVHDESFIVIPFSTECNVTIYNEAEWICMDDTGPHWLADNVSCTRILTPD